MSKLNRAKKVYSEEGLRGLVKISFYHYINKGRRRLNMVKGIINNVHKLAYSRKDINVLSDRETIRYLENNDVGIVRYGDGELAYLTGGGTSHEHSNVELSKKIRNILNNYNKKTERNEYVVGLPISLTLDNEFKKRNADSDYWQYYKKYSMIPFLKANVKYASPFCFRVDTIDHNNPEAHVEEVRSLFNEKNIIYVSDGRELEGVDIVEDISIPSENAFQDYNIILNNIVDRAGDYNNVLILISGGVTATAMSAHLNKNGILTYDIGKLYRWL